LAEIVKYGIIFDRKILKLLNSLALEKINPGKLNELISLPQFEDITYSCAKIKTTVVKKDEFDNNYRNLLNFGHTAGHAIEKISGFKGLNHGQAVAIGMIVAIDISISLGLLKDSLRQDIIELYKKLKLPNSVDIGENLSREKLADDIFDAMKFDKKFSASANKFVLLKGINRPVFYHNVEAKIIKEAILKNISIKL
jgi:3-dehydroquinate synthase